VALLTLLINSPTCGPLINFLGIINEHIIKIKVFAEFLEIFIEQVEEQTLELKSNRHMQMVNW